MNRDLIVANNVAAVDSLDIEPVAEPGVGKTERAEIAFNTSGVGNNRKDADGEFDKTVVIFREPLPDRDEVQWNILRISCQRET